MRTFDIDVAALFCFSVAMAMVALVSCFASVRILTEIHPAWDGSRASRLFGRPTFQMLALKGPQPFGKSVDVMVTSGGTFLYIPWRSDVLRTADIAIDPLTHGFVALDNPSVRYIGTYHVPVRGSNDVWQPAQRNAVR